MFKPAAIGLSAALLAGTGALADSRSELRLLQMQTLMQAAQKAGVTPLSTKPTKLKFHVSGTFKAQTTVTKPLRCEVVFSHVGSNFLFYSAAKSALVAFNGTTGTCLLDVFADWPMADSNNPVGITIMLSTDDAVRSESEIAVMYNQPMPAIPLPATGTTQNITFTVLAP